MKRIRPALALADRAFSPLALDVAISRTSLAAVKIRAGLEPIEAEIESAIKLRDYLKKWCPKDNNPKSLERAIPSEPMRLALQRTFSRVRQVDKADNTIGKSVDALLPILEKLGDRKQLDSQEATQMIDLLRQLEQSQQPQMFR